MTYRERLQSRLYNSNGEEVARIRVKLEYYRGILLWSTIQLEGLIFGKWLPLIRYDFDPKDRIPVHVNKEYISTNDNLNKSEFNCHPDFLILTAWKLLISMSDYKILDLIEKRKQVFLNEGK